MRWCYEQRIQSDYGMKLIKWIEAEDDDLQSALKKIHFPTLKEYLDAVRRKEEEENNREEAEKDKAGQWKKGDEQNEVGKEEETSEESEKNKNSDIILITREPRVPNDLIADSFTFWKARNTVTNSQITQ